MARVIYEYHPIFGKRFIAGIKARIEHEGGGYLIRANGAGFRSDREYQRQKDPNTFRVLVFGDSFDAGDGVPNKARFTDVLETLIGGAEVYNFGLSGTGTDQQYFIWRDQIPGMNTT